MKRRAHNAIHWSEDMVCFLQNNFSVLTNKELADSLGLKLTVVRYKLHELGLIRMEMEYWSEDMVAYLHSHYKLKGDTEIAEDFARLYPKNKPWTKKHIDKKRGYLGLYRTEVEIQAIHARNVAQGKFRLCPVKAWATRGIPKVGTIIHRKIAGHSTPFLKTEAGYKKVAHVNWEQVHGAIPAGHIVTNIDGNSLNCAIANLAMMTKADNMNRNTIHRYPESIKETIRIITKLKKTVYEKQN